MNKKSLFLVQALFIYNAAANIALVKTHMLHNSHSITHNFKSYGILAARNLSYNTTNAACSTTASEPLPDNIVGKKEQAPFHYIDEAQCTGPINDNKNNIWHAILDKDIRQIKEVFDLPEKLDMKIWRYCPEGNNSLREEIIVGISHGTFANNSQEFNEPLCGDVLSHVLPQFADKPRKEQRNATVFTLQWNGKNNDSERRKFGKQKAQLYNKLSHIYEIYDINHSHACNASFIMLQHLNDDTHIKRLICFNPPLRDEYLKFLCDRKTQKHVEQIDIYASQYDRIVPFGHISSIDYATLFTSLYNMVCNTPSIFIPQNQFPGVQTACIWIDPQHYCGHSACKSLVMPYFIDVCQKIDTQFNQYIDRQERIELIATKTANDIQLSPYSGTRKKTMPNIATAIFSDIGKTITRWLTCI